MSLFFFPAAVLTASGSKGMISARGLGTPNKRLKLGKNFYIKKAGEFLAGFLLIYLVF